MNLDSSKSTDITIDNLVQIVSLNIPAVLTP